MAANETRGEVSLTLDGAEFVLRPSYDAIVEFEGATGRTLIDLAQAAGSGGLSLSDAAAIVTACIKAWGRATDNKGAAGVNAKRIAELLIEDGILLATKRIELVLFLAATGGVTASGEVKRPTTTSETETPAAAKRGSRRPR